MKKFILSLVLIGTAYITTEVKAQKNVIKTNILSPAFYSGSISFEHAFNWAMSYDVGISYTPATEISNIYTDGRTELSGYSATIGLRKYRKKNAPDGFYFGPYLRHQNITFKASDYTAILTASSAGIKTGYQFIINEVFSIDIFYGSGVGMYEISGEDIFDDITEITGTGKIISGAATYGFNMGFAF
jgi:hypothetical protein